MSLFMLRILDLASFSPPASSFFSSSPGSRKVGRAPSVVGKKNGAACGLVGGFKGLFRSYFRKKIISIKMVCYDRKVMVNKNRKQK